MKHILFLPIAVAFFHGMISNALCAETYTIDNNRVLLYKLINWWNESSLEESNQLCGRPIKCKSEGDAQIEYDEADRILKLQIKGGFADLLSIFKQCDKCFGPSYLKCTWLNRNYFGSSGKDILPAQTIILPPLYFHNIDKEQVKRIRSIEKNLAFELEGVIGGLLLESGKIALHRAGKFLKSCPEVSRSQENGYPISFRIIHSETNEVLAKYDAIFEF